MEFHLENVETLNNGVEVVYAFGKLEAPETKKVLFLAGTTSWNSDLLNASWRRRFIDEISTIDFEGRKIAVCVPEPKEGVLKEEYNRHLIDWETEYLDLASVHAYWLNTYWDYPHAINGCTESSARYFSDGDAANIGVTVRSELGASIGRYKYGDQSLGLIVGCPADAQGLAWLFIQCKLLAIPIYRLQEKTEAYDRNWFNAILFELFSHE